VARSPSGFSQCKSRMTKLQARGALADLDIGGAPEVVCTRWLMGPVEGIGINGWPVFRHLLNKDSVVYQLGEMPLFHGSGAFPGP